MNKRTCVNPHYRLQREIKVMERMRVHHGSPEEQLAWVDKYSPRERQYACGECPSVGLCKFINRYRLKEKKNETTR